MSRRWWITGGLVVVLAAAGITWKVLSGADDPKLTTNSSSRACSDFGPRGGSLAGDNDLLQRSLDAWREHISDVRDAEDEDVRDAEDELPSEVCAAYAASFDGDPYVTLLTSGRYAVIRDRGRSGPRVVLSGDIPLQSMAVPAGAGHWLIGDGYSGVVLHVDDAGRHVKIPVSTPVFDPAGLIKAKIGGETTEKLPFVMTGSRSPMTYAWTASREQGGGSPAARTVVIAEEERELAKQLDTPGAVGLLAGAVARDTFQPERRSTSTLLDIIGQAPAGNRGNVMVLRETTYGGPQPGSTVLALFGPPGQRGARQSLGAIPPGVANGGWAGGTFLKTVGPPRSAADRVFVVAGATARDNSGGEIALTVRIGAATVERKGPIAVLTAAEVPQIAADARRYPAVAVVGALANGEVVPTLGTAQATRVN